MTKQEFPTKEVYTSPHMKLEEAPPIRRSVTKTFKKRWFGDSLKKVSSKEKFEYYWNGKWSAIPTEQEYIYI